MLFNLKNSDLKIIQLQVPNKLFIQLDTVIPMLKDSPTSSLLFPQNKNNKFGFSLFANLFQNTVFKFTNFK